MRTFWKHYALGVAVLGLGLISAPASAHCDFMTGGGWIERPNGAKANFGVAGGCKKAGPDAPFWGHLNYLDHGNTPPPGAVPPPFHVHWLTITAYQANFADSGPEKDPKRTGTREVCGTATTNHPLYPLVDFHVQVTDHGEPGSNDVFMIRLGVNGVEIYTTFTDPDTRLGSGGPGGGNIQLHKPNPSTTGDFGGICNI